MKAHHPAMTMSEIRVSVDVVILTIREGQLQLLLVRRGIPPFEGAWAIPGGFVLGGEPLDQVARGKLLEEAGVSDVYLEQLHTFGAPGRDPRGRVITVAYLALLPNSQAFPAGSDAGEARWWPTAALPDLAFDHAEISGYGLERLRKKLEYTTVGFQLLPERFTLPDLQQVYEAILGRTIDKRNFRRKIGRLGVLTPLKEMRRGGRTRPARLYRFSATRSEDRNEKGILFPS